jgi:uncharacterized protein YjbI with pentapeptide repeats
MILQSSQGKRRILQSQSFRGQNLLGHDFSNSDIRGCDFTNANLRNANFTGALIGVPQNRLSFLLLINFGIAFLLSLPPLVILCVSIFNVVWRMSGVFPDKPEGIIDTLLILLVPVLNSINYVVILLGVCIWGFSRKNLLRLILICILVSIVKIIPESLNLFNPGSINFMQNYYGNYGEFISKTFGFIAAFIFALIYTIFTTSIISVLFFLIQFFASSGAFMSFVYDDKNKEFKNIDVVKSITPMFILMLVLIPIGSFFVAYINSNVILPGQGASLIRSMMSFNHVLTALSVLATIILLQISLSYYAALQALQGKSGFSTISDLTVSIASGSGTKFNTADLTEADFSYSNVKFSDFRDTSLNQVRWYQASFLSLNRFAKGSYLSDSFVLKLVTTLNGQEGEFARKELCSINLRGANLKKADFSGADLTFADLRETDLFEANLAATNLNSTNFEDAILTGAYIEKWRATKTTVFNNVICDYVHMRVPTEGQRDPGRKPPTGYGNFKEGEFQNFVSSLIDTLDLYHQNDVDPRAVVIALKELSEEFDDDFTIVAIERMKGGQLTVRVKVSDETDVNIVEGIYYPRYEKVKGLLPTNVETVPSQFVSLTNAINSVRDSSQSDGMIVKIRVNAKTAHVLQGDINMTNFSNSPITNTGTGVFNFGSISGTVDNSSGQSSSSSDPGKDSLDELLSLLKNAIEHDSDLSDEVRSDLLRQLKVMVDARSINDKQERDGLFRQAKTVFSSIVSGLSNTASVVEASQSLFPQIMEIMKSMS